MSLMRSAAVVVLCLGALPHAFATDRFFPNINAKSPSGRYRLTAKSPDNQVTFNGRFGRPKAFQGRFQYTFTDTKTGKVLWTRIPENPEQNDALRLPPMDIYVDESGWSVTQTSANQLVCVSPSGEMSDAIEILRHGMTKRDRDRYVVETSAGPDWESMSLWYFLDNGAQRLFVIRPWWGSHILVDVEQGKFVTDATEHAGAIRKHETAQVLEKLKDAVANGEEEDSWNNQLHTAILLAGKFQLFESDEYLRVLENSDRLDQNRKAWIDKRKYAIGGNYQTRQFAQLSLRRIGETPKPLPAYKILVRDMDKTTSPPTERISELTVKRDHHENAGKIKEGMTQTDVIDLLGVPDSMTYFFKWTYDFDSKKPFSLKITFDFETKKVNRIVRMRPAEWKIGIQRDRELASLR